MASPRENLQDSVCEPGKLGLFFESVTEILRCCNSFCSIPDLLVDSPDIFFFILAEAKLGETDGKYHGNWNEYSFW